MGFDNAQYWIGQHLLGPDNKIYITTDANSGSNVSLDYKLSVINYPDSVGYACDIRLHSIGLGGHRARGGLPNLPHYELGPLVGSACDTLTGIAQLDKGKGGLKVYPNPASKQLTISHSHLAIGQPVTVTVYDVMGKQQLQVQTKMSNSLNVAVGSLVSGIYFVEVKQGNMVVNAKFVKT
jgi:hypothetical protein